MQRKGTVFQAERTAVNIPLSCYDIKNLFPSEQKPKRPFSVITSLGHLWVVEKPLLHETLASLSFCDITTHYLPSYYSELSDENFLSSFSSSTFLSSSRYLPDIQGNTHTHTHTHTPLSFHTEATDSSWPNLPQLSYDSCDSSSHPRNNSFEILFPSMGIIHSQIPQKKTGIGEKK